MITTFVLFLMMPFVYAQEIPDYDNPYAPILFDKPFYTWTDKVIITIIAPSWNADRNLIDSIGSESSHAIKISSRDFSLDQYRLTETDVSSGIFKGEVILTGFSHDADGDGDIDTNPRTIGNGPTNGFLETERNSAITVSFEFADGVVLTESVPISWNLGTIEFSQKNFLDNDDVVVRIVDLDMNLNPEAIDQIPVDISSDSDIAGIQVSAVETSESTGMFETVISISQNSSSGNRLYALIGDKIYAKYDDNTLPEPYSINDNLEIHATANLESSIKPIDRLTNLKIILSDRSSNPLSSFVTNNQIQIVGSLSNTNLFNQDFVYIFQIKDDAGAVDSVSWVVGSTSPNQNLDVSQSWTPKKSGTYTVETFVWESLSSNIPLAYTLSKSFFVQ